MTVVLYNPGLGHAHTLISAGKVDKDSPWSFTGDDAQALLGPDGNDWVNFGAFHLGEDTSATAKTEARFKYPYGKGGKVYLSAVRAIRSRASQQGETSIFYAAVTLMDAINPPETSK